MNVPRGFLDMVSNDIEQLSNVDSLSVKELITLHRTLLMKIQS